MKTGTDDDHQVIVDMSNDVVFPGLEVKRRKQKNSMPRSQRLI